MKTQTFDEMANLYYPQGCQCHDDSGSCDWCRVYYGEDKPWIDEEGRELPLPKQTARKPGETLTDWTLRFMADALRTSSPLMAKELNRQVEASRERDANTYVIEA